MVKKKQTTYKKILKKVQPTLKLSQKKIESTWDDTSRFFKQEMEEVSNSLFFS